MNRYHESGSQLAKAVWFDAFYDPDKAVKVDKDDISRLAIRI